MEIHFENWGLLIAYTCAREKGFVLALELKDFGSYVLGLVQKFCTRCTHGKKRVLVNRARNHPHNQRLPTCTRNHGNVYTLQFCQLPFTSTFSNDQGWEVWCYK